LEWSQADLDRLLREAGDSDEVTIAFDRDEMGAAIDAETDVEAHGLREKAIVLTVVAVSALSTAGAAQAMPASGGSGAAAPVVSAAAPTPAESPATTIGGADSASTVASDASPATTIGGAGPAPTTAPATSTSATASSVTQVRGEAAARTLPSAVGDSSLPSGGEAAVIGVAGIAIVAAGFAAAGTRRKTVRPA
jgi:hypothetical protein